ncbi:6092_t:CDS:1, partial [Gigaspora margarita]
NLFQSAPQNLKPRMENIEDTQIQQVQPSTLNNIRRFITEWNQDPVSQTHDLIITKDQFYTINRYDIPYQLPTEELLPPIGDISLRKDNEVFDNVIPLSLPEEESLVTHDDISLLKDTEILAPVTENLKQIDNSVDSEKDYSCRIRNDLLVRSNNTPFRQNP